MAALITQTIETLSISVTMLFHFLIIQMFTGVSLFNTLQERFLCIHNLVLGGKRPGFWPLLVFNVPSSLNWIISNFWFKVRRATLFFTWAHRSHCRLIKWPKFYTALSQRIEGEKGRETGECPISGAFGTHTHLSVKSALLWWFMVPQHNDNGKIANHRSPWKI